MTGKASQITSCILALLFFGCSTSGNLALGSNAYIKGAPSAAGVGTTLDDLKEWETALAAKDKYGGEELIASGKVLIVPNGTKVLIIDTHGGLAYNVRILEGQFINRSGWTDAEWLVAAK